MTEQVLDLRRALRALRRRWILLLVSLMAGIGSGALVARWQEPAFVARAGVLLPPSALDARGRPLRNIETEERIASSAEILRRAGRTLHPPSSPTDLRRRIKVQGVGSDILEIQAEAPSGRDAALLADAVAREYVAFASGATGEQADASVAVLQAQATELEDRIRSLEDGIAANTARLAGMDQRSPEGARLGAIIDSQRSSQVDAARQLSALNTRIADARLNAELNRRGLRVLEPATRPRAPSRHRMMSDMSIGGVIGLIAGVIAALARERGDRRLRTRDEIANVVGEPVLASATVSPPKRVKDYRNLLEHWAPSAVDSLVFRQAFTAIGAAVEETPENLGVIALPGDDAALGLAVEAAVFASAFGAPTGLMIATRHASAANLRSACNAAARDRSEVRPNLWVHDASTGIEARGLESTELTVTIASAGDEPLILPTGGRRTFTVFALSSGFATAETVAAAVLASLDAGHPVHAVMVANPEPNDETTGRLIVTPSAQRKSQDRVSPTAATPPVNGSADRQSGAPLVGRMTDEGFQ